MNRIDFLKYTTFPLDSNTMDFMQEMIETVVSMSAVCGDNVIVSGCFENGNQVSDGLVIINGELLKFKGDVKVAKVYIEETREQVVCLEETFDDLYIRRCVKFGNGDGTNNLNWSDFRRLDNIPELMGKIIGLQASKSNIGHTHTITEVTNLPTSVVPKGLIAMWSGSTTAIPEGWALCDGNTVNGVQTPNLKGKFIVGYNSVDSSFNRVGMSGGSKSLSLGKDHLPKHSHSFNDYFRFDDPNLDLVSKGVADGKYTVATGEGNKNGGETSNAMYYRRNTTDEMGSGKSFDLLPPYYVLAYIIKL